MGSFKAFVAIGTSLLAFGTTAKAADLSRPMPPLEQRTPSLIDDTPSGWYVRGDIGYRLNRVGSVANLAPVPAFDNKMSASAVLGMGVGYKLQWFRTDLTVDYGTKAKYSGSTAALAPDFTARVDSVTALGNFYGDLGTWYGLTPYLGLGAGGAYLRTGDFSQASRPPVGAAPTSNRWNFAWAWMAGVSYTVSPSFMVDFGYRRTSFGSAVTAVDFYGNQLTLKNLSADEFRVGLRLPL